MEIDVLLFLRANQIDLPKRLINKLLNQKFYDELTLYKEIEKIILEHTSQFLFPNHYIAFYPQVKEFKAKSDVTCNLSGAIIKKNEFYYCYHPLIEDLNTNKVYTISKNIKASLGYQDKFPLTLAHYEEWYYKLKNAYYHEDDEIDFYFLSVEAGDTAFEVVELKKGTLTHKIKLIKKEIKKLEELRLQLIKNKMMVLDEKEVLNKIKKLDLRINRLSKNLVNIYNETTN